MARSAGIETHLIDGPDDIRPDWFSPDDRVLLTAGASAPEAVVQRCVAFLQEHFGAIVEPSCLREEQVHFPLPEPVRDP